MQRDLLALLATDNERGDRFHGGMWWNKDGRQRTSVRREDNEWTTSDLCSAYNRTHEDWWWDETATRQVRRALDALHRVGRVNKRIIEHGTYNGTGSLSLWSLGAAGASAEAPIGVLLADPRTDPIEADA